MNKNENSHSLVGYARQGDELIRFCDSKRATPSDFDTDKTVILIHGFTAHGDYLKSLATELVNHDYNVLVYNYYSLNGILRAAKSLAEKLLLLNELANDNLKTNKVSLICHSMGGLVGKSLFLLTPGKDFVSSLVTIGTPHKGTLTNAKLMKHLINAGEYLSGKTVSYRPECLSAKELMGKDGYKNIGLLSTLESEIEELEDIPILSISGGRNYLEVGNNTLLNYVANRYIQNQLSEKNDGLVQENSSRPLSGSNSVFHPMSEHLNNYSDYYDVNHSHLVNSQVIGLNIAVWLKRASNFSHGNISS